MNCISQCATLAQSEQGRRTRAFRKSLKTRLSPEAAARQARISLLAFCAHVERVDALAFLNGHSALLNGRPLDVAALSDEDLAAASAALVVSSSKHDPLLARTTPELTGTAEARTELMGECPDRGRADG